MGGDLKIFILCYLDLDILWFILNMSVSLSWNVYNCFLQILKVNHPHSKNQWNLLYFILSLVTLKIEHLTHVKHNLGPRDVAVNKVDKNSCPHGAYSEVL